MAPVEIQLLVPRRDPEILWVNPGQKRTIKNVLPVELQVSCREDDKGGDLQIDGPLETVKVTKYLSNRHQHATQPGFRQQAFTEQESFQITSPFYDEQVIISHMSVTPKGPGKITR